MIEYCRKKACEIPHKKGKFRHYAVVLDKKGRIVSEGRNSYVKTHTHMHKASRKLGLEKDFLHAEVAALLKSKGVGVKLVVVRVDCNGELMYSKPCPVCELLISEAEHIESVEYSI